ncbi:MAG: hypothetical protein HC924_16605 [Synechococcaceae cyanobacterium SM2_3_2]|nr:hypothetical protein [Synechococcaceae cyanobacterium SM2_3_2]
MSFMLIHMEFYDEYTYEYLIYKFMRSIRYSNEEETETTIPHPLSFEDQPFVGMWADREDMANSTQWVRSIRQQQWSRKGE